MLRVIGGAANLGRRISYTGRGANEADRAVYTFGNRYFGQPNAGRFIIVGISNRAPETVTQVEVQGQSATHQFGFGNVEFWTAPEENTRYGQIVITLDDTGVGIVIYTWVGYGLDSATAHNAQSGIGPSPEVNLNVPANGAIVGWAEDGGVFNSLVHDFEETVESGSFEGTGGSISNRAANAAYLIRADRTGLAGNGRLVALSWG